MEAVKQSGQYELETTADLQRAKVSSRRKMIIAVACVTFFYIVWGIFRVVS